MARNSYKGSGIFDGLLKAGVKVGAAAFQDINNQQSYSCSSMQGNSTKGNWRLILMAICLAFIFGSSVFLWCVDDKMDSLGYAVFAIISGVPLFIILYVLIDDYVKNRKKRRLINLMLTEQRDLNLNALPQSISEKLSDPLFEVTFYLTRPVVTKEQFERVPHTIGFRKLFPAYEVYFEVWNEVYWNLTLSIKSFNLLCELMDEDYQRVDGDYVDGFYKKISKRLRAQFNIFERELYARWRINHGHDPIYTCIDAEEYKDLWICRTNERFKQKLNDNYFDRLNKACDEIWHHCKRYPEFSYLSNQDLKLIDEYNLSQLHRSFC